MLLLQNLPHCLRVLVLCLSSFCLVLRDLCLPIMQTHLFVVQRCRPAAALSGNSPEREACERETEINRNKQEPKAKAFYALRSKGREPVEGSPGRLLFA